MAEHVVVELDAQLHLGETGTDDAAHVREGLVGHLLGTAHELDFLVVLDGAKLDDVVVELGEARSKRAVFEGTAQLRGLRERDGVLDADDAGCHMGLQRMARDPGPHAAQVHVELPRGVGTERLEERVVVARIGVEEKVVLRDEGSVRVLEVENARRAREPAQVGIVAQHERVIATLLHEAANLGNPVLNGHVRHLSLRYVKKMRRKATGAPLRTKDRLPCRRHRKTTAHGCPRCSRQQLDTREACVRAALWRARNHPGRGESRGG